MRVLKKWWVAHGADLLGVIPNIYWELKQPTLLLVWDQSKGSERDLSENHGVFFTFFKALNLPGESFNETSLWCQSEGNSLTSLSGFGLIALPLHGSVTQGGYEDIHHSGLGGFKVLFFFSEGKKG